MNKKENLDSIIWNVILDIGENYQDVISLKLTSVQHSPKQLLYIIKMCQISFKRSHFVLYQRFKTCTALVHEVMSTVC